jgi:peptidoglycan/LPS O-acetylase OafA/YrhL
VFPSRYELLDGLRGVAALGVVLHHHHVAELGHASVILFFLISGYCITAAAASVRATGGDAFRGFMARRIRRIYPPYLLALVFFLVTRLVKVWLGLDPQLPSDPVTWLQNLTLTQWLSLIAHPGDPADNPALLVSAFWSLNYEEQFYLVVAVALLFTSARAGRLLAIIAATTLASLLWLAAFGVTTYHGVFLEYWPHFALGSALYFALCHAPLARWRSLVGLAFAALAIAATLAGLRTGMPPAPRIAGELALLGCAGLALLVARPHAARLYRLPLWRPLAALGTISYSLYLVHQFNITLADTIGRELARLVSLPGLATTLAVLAQLGIATAFWYCCERPFQGRAAPRLPAAGVAARAT